MHPDIGIGVRPRGPLVFQVAERLSLISDAIYLEGARAQRLGTAAGEGPRMPAGIGAADQARAVAWWLLAGHDDVAAAFPGRSWLRQPPECSDREWILEIARQYRALSTPSSKARDVAGTPAGSAPG